MQEPKPDRANLEVGPQYPVIQSIRDFTFENLTVSTVAHVSRME
jgi:hypothetical protein